MIQITAPDKRGGSKRLANIRAGSFIHLCFIITDG